MFMLKDIREMWSQFSLSVESQFIMLHAMQKDFRLTGLVRRLLGYHTPSHGRNKTICLAKPRGPFQDSR